MTTHVLSFVSGLTVDCMKLNPGKILSVILLGGVAIAARAQSNPEPVQMGDRTAPFSTDVSLHPPAVSEINGKISYSGGSMNSEEGHNFDGSISFPILQQFGFQADALYSRISDEDFYGAAGHLFWRNPDFGLVGVTGGYLYRSGVDTFQVGAEGEYYLGRFTFSGFAGVGSISYANAAPFIDTNPTRFVGRVSADYYPLDDLRLGVSYVTAFRDNLVKGEAEYQTPIHGLALTGEVAAGDNGYDHWLLGVRYYFGGNKSLRERQRRDDPRSLMPQILHGLGVYGAEFNRKGRTYLAAHPGSGSLDGGGGYGYSAMQRIIGGTDGLPTGQPPAGWPPRDIGNADGNNGVTENRDGGSRPHDPLPPRR
jgi:hypothetical protein